MGRFHLKKKKEGNNLRVILLKSRSQGPQGERKSQKNEARRCKIQKERRVVGDNNKLGAQDPGTKYLTRGEKTPGKQSSTSGKGRKVDGIGWKKKEPTSQVQIVGRWKIKEEDERLRLP